MVAHLVLFRPKASLTDGQRTQLIAALEHALANIPLIQRAQIGRRITLGRLYDQMNPQDFPFFVLLEFANESDLRAYLDHPAHEKLGEQFYLASDAALAFDFEQLDLSRLRDLL